MTPIDTVRVVARLADPSAAVRWDASRYITALLHLCDEEHDRLRAVEVQKWMTRKEETEGGGYGFGEDEAEQLRRNLVWSISRVVVPEEAVEAVYLVKFLLEDSARRDNLVAAFSLLRQIRSREADVLVGKTLVASAGYPAIRTRALEEIARRGLASERQQVIEHCRHYDARTRAAARAAAAKLALDAPPEAGTADMFTGRLARFLERTAASTDPVVAPADRWVRVAPLSGPKSRPVTEPGATEAPADALVQVPLADEWPEFGRVVSEADGQIVIVDWDGFRLDLPADSDRLSNATAADAVALLVEWRGAHQAKVESGSTRSPQRTVESRLPYENLGRAEYVVGSWCFAAGELELARTCIVPLLEAAEDEDAVFNSIQHDLALYLASRMLGHFVDKRDYAAAVRIGRRLQSPVFDGFYFQELALELAEQLPRRAADFATLRLPSAASWAEMRRTLSRNEQVEFLASRLRLIYCPQMAIPGDCDYSLPQTPEPVDWRRVLLLDTDDWMVINPFVELLEMKLTGEEAIHLLPTMLSDDFVLGFNLPRFAFGWPLRLHRAAWVAGEIVNRVLQENVVRFEFLTPARSTERARHVEALRERLSKER